MKSSEHQHCCHVGFGILIGLFGIFFLVGNLMPEQNDILRFWPIFLIAGGFFKALSGWFCKFKA